MFNEVLNLILISQRNSNRYTCIHIYMSVKTISTSTVKCIKSFEFCLQVSSLIDALMTSTLVIKPPIVFPCPKFVTERGTV